MEGQLKNRDYWQNIWELFKAGNRIAFNEIYNQFIDQLFAYGMKISPNKDLVQDSIQELFVNLYKYRTNLDNPDYLEFYLFKSLRRIIVKELKKEKNFTQVDESNSYDFKLQFNLEEELLQSESEINRQQSLAKVLANLDSGKRELIYLKFYSGLNYKEIGNLLGIKPDTAKKQVYRLIEDLKEKFGKKLLEMFYLCFRT